VRFAEGEGVGETDGGAVVRITVGEGVGASDDGALAGNEAVSTRPWLLNVGLSPLYIQTPSAEEKIGSDHGLTFASILLRSASVESSIIVSGSLTLNRLHTISCSITSRLVV